MKYIYKFGNKKAEGDRSQKELLGGKGANLAEMVNMGIPVPPGFTISTDVCKYFYEHKKQYPAEMEGQVDEGIRTMEEWTGKGFGKKENPLLVSVRSGAAVSMPGMMDTVLNLGLNEEIVEGLEKLTGNKRFVWDAYRRFLQMFGNVVSGIEHEKFEGVLEEVKQAKGKKEDTEMSAEDWQEVVGEYKKMYKVEKGEEFPSEPREQLKRAIDAVFGSWNNPRAIAYRKINKIDESKVYGTAVNVQAMVFGNMGDDSGTGVAFTRNPSTGEKGYWGEYLMNAQGEDVVAGIRTPKPISNLAEDNEVVYKELTEIFDKLEDHFADMQDMEFTIENGKLYLLQTRNGKRTAAAAVRIAVEMEKEGLIDEKTALLRVEPEKLDDLLHPTIDPSAKQNFRVLTKGLPASPGAASGTVVFTAEEAVSKSEAGEKVILVRMETSPEDITGMNVAQGILTARGGMTSHAAVVARGMGKCCVAGCSEAVISEKAKTAKIGEEDIKEGDVITLDGSTGEVFLGEVPKKTPELSGDFGTLMKWAKKYKRMGVRTNADTPKDAKTAREFGAEGIGLCRTEHMFFEEDRIFAVRQMIMSETVEQRKKALEKLFPMQKNDFKQLFEIMKGLPVKIRLLDPPLHEFVPHEDKDIEALAKEMGLSFEKLKEKVESLHEFNPMMGHRGCRLGVSFPEIYEMQVRAIMAAGCEVGDVVPEIMIPLVGHVDEYRWLKERLEKVIEATMKEYGKKLRYEMGTMIEVPRAAVVAGEIAKEAEFFSFGTNDLTQMTFGFSRDDSGKFLKDYLNEKILPEDPFKSLDIGGVGELMKWTVEKGRATRKNMSIGICGEQGGDPATVEFCHKIGLSYVSCSPYRVPIAILAAARATVQ